MGNVSLLKESKADEHTQLEAMADALVTILTPLCKAIVDEYLSNLNVSVDPRNESRRKAPWRAHRADSLGGD